MHCGPCSASLYILLSVLFCKSIKSNAFVQSCFFGIQAMQCLVTTNMSVGIQSYDIKPKDARSLLLVLHDYSCMALACSAC